MCDFPLLEGGVLIAAFNLLKDGMRLFSLSLFVTKRKPKPERKKGVSLFFCFIFLKGESCGKTEKSKLRDREIKLNFYSLRLWWYNLFAALRVKLPRRSGNKSHKKRRTENSHPRTWKKINLFLLRNGEKEFFLESSERGEKVQSCFGNIKGNGKKKVNQKGLKINVTEMFYLSLVVDFSVSFIVLFS